MQFEIICSDIVSDGQLIYVPEDYSFDYNAENRHGAEYTIQLDTLQLAVDGDGRVLYPWGYCPLIRFAVTEHIPPSSRRGILVVECADNFIPGISVGLHNDAGWPVAINRQEGWVCIGDPSVPELCEAVEFANSAVAVLSEGKLVALLLRPYRLPQASSKPEISS